MEEEATAISAEWRVRSMNNRYLYRAKHSLNSKKWHIGNLVEEPDGLYLRDNKNNIMVYIQDPSTICQCTGLKDKNGNLIWENDICRRILLPTKRIKTIFRIAYVPYKCCLSAIDLDGSNVTFLSDYINNQYEVEVIGNIFDNPELLQNYE